MSYSTEYALCPGGECLSTTDGLMAIKTNPSTEYAKPTGMVIVSSTSSSTNHISHSRDQLLVMAARSGSPTAFNELWNLYHRRIFNTVFTITKNREDAEDALQESFLRAYLALGSFEGRASFYSWMTRIAINSALMLLRKRRNHPEICLNTTHDSEEESAPMDFKDTSPDPEQSYEQLERGTKLVRAIRRLSPNLREVVQTRLTEECSLREAADRLNISEGAAKSRLYRARRRLDVLTKGGNRHREQGRFSDSSIPIAG